jgi:hypothetical protein
MLIARYVTIGTPVPDPDGGPFDIGYDDCRSGIAFYRDDEHMAEDWASGDFHTLKVICEIECLGL